MNRLCNYKNCEKRAAYGLMRDNPIRCKKHKESMRFTLRMCICGKSEKACYNEITEHIAICCTKCKTNTMVDIIHKKCKCGLIPVFNEPGEIKGLCCSKCKSDNMVNVIDKKCKCGKAIPSFNEPGETISICCISCKTDTMINVISKKCKCGKSQPHLNEPGEKTPICCSSCKTDTMVDVVSKKCICKKVRPNFNEPGETIAICCISCKTDTMVNVLSKKCICGKSQPRYNEPDEKTPICCSSCKTDTMVNVLSIRCPCGDLARYNEPGIKKPIYCSSCKINTMVDISNLNRKCDGLIINGIIEDCPYDHYGTSKYNNYCTECFRYNFPDDPLTIQIRIKTKEIAVREFINKNFDGFQHDKYLFTGHCDCTVRRRIDHRKLLGNTLLVVETDENQHKSYDEMDEEIRYDDLYMAFSGKWIYIRFNPDKYLNKNSIIKDPTIQNRFEILKLEIEKQIKRIEFEENKDLIEHIYLYYDDYD
jgi:hypothetical protein